MVIYKKLLLDVDKEVVGTVENLAKEYNMDVVYFAGFLEVINVSIEKPNPIEKLPLWRRCLRYRSQPRIPYICI